MQIVSFIALKGGVGKSSATATLADGLARKHLDVAVIDASDAVPYSTSSPTTRPAAWEPSLHSPLENWAFRQKSTSRRLGTLEGFQVFSSTQLHETLDRLRLDEFFDIVLIDTPAVRCEVCAEAAQLADLVFFTCRTEQDASALLFLMTSALVDTLEKVHAIIVGARDPVRTRLFLADYPALATEILCHARGEPFFRLYSRGGTSRGISKDQISNSKNLAKEVIGLLKLKECESASQPDPPKV